MLVWSLSEGAVRGMSAPTSVDMHVGNRIRLVRGLRGVSQGKLAEALGITFQQVQKYERGTNRIGAGRLYEIARVLEIPIGFFFEGLGRYSNGNEEYVLRDAATPLRPTLNVHEQAEQNDLLEDAKLLTSSETLKLVKAYYRVQNVTMRRQILQLLKNLAEQDI